MREPGSGVPFFPLIMLTRQPMRPTLWQYAFAVTIVAGTYCAPAIAADVVAGQIQATFATAPGAVPFIKDANIQTE